MFRITVRESKEAAKKYYTEKARQDYYSQGQELLGSWGGKGAKMLGLEGEVGAREFIALCDNLNPSDGHTLTQRQNPNRIPGYDLNFHCPKSVSVLYMWTGDEKIMRAFREAVRETMEQIESWTNTRVRKGGEDTTRLTGNLVWAEFVHLTARPEGKLPDPHLHAHCFTFNATYDEIEKQWKAAHIKDIYDNAPFFHAAFLLKLSNNLNALGYATRPVAKAFEIVGMPEELNKQFSKRTLKIKETAERLGITDPILLDKLGALTRKAKLTDVSYPELRKLWRQEVSAAHAEILDDLFVKRPLKQQLGQHPLEQPMTAADWDYIRKVSQGRKVTAESALALLGPSGKAPPKSRIKPDPAIEQRALDRAILHNFYRKSVVSEFDILAEAMARSYGAPGVTLTSLEQAMRRHPEFIFKTINKKRLVTTRTVLAEEMNAVRWVKAGMGMHAPLIEGYKIQDKMLNDQQQAAVLHVLGSRDWVTAIEGKSGTGKTRLMAEVVAAIKGQSIPVLVMAPSTQAVEETLVKRGFPDAQTVEQLLVNKRLQEQHRGGVLMVDEAGMMSGQLMVRLFSLADELGARIVTLGDTGQHRAVQRGDAMRGLYKFAKLKPIVVSKIMRQKGDYKEWMELLAAGKMEEAFHEMDRGGAINIIEDENERYKAVAKKYVELLREGHRPGLVVPSHAEGRLVTEALRQELKDNGELQGERTFQQLRRIDMTPADQADWQSYRAGWWIQYHRPVGRIERGDRFEIDHIDEREGEIYLKVPYATRIGKRAEGIWELDLEKSLGAFSVFEPAELSIAPGERIRITNNGMPKYGKKAIKRGSEHTVTGFDEAGDIILESGMVLEGEFAHFTYGYVRTSMGAQSMDVEKVIVVEGPLSYPAMSREQQYVDAGRARKELIIYGADKAEMLEAILPSSHRFSAMEFMEMPADPEMTPEDVAVYLGDAQARAEAPLKEQPLKEHLGQKQEMPQPPIKPEPVPLKEHLGRTPERQHEAVAAEPERETTTTKPRNQKLTWSLQAKQPKVTRAPARTQLGQQTELFEKKLEWSLQAVQPNVQRTTMSENLGEKKKFTEKLEWSLPVTPPPPAPKPEDEDLEPDIEGGMQPPMMP